MTDDRCAAADYDEETEAHPPAAHAADAEAPGQQAGELQTPEAQTPETQTLAVEPSDQRVAAAESPDPRVAAAVDRLDELAAKDPAEHVEIYEQVHRDLQDALAEAADQRTTSTADQSDDQGAAIGDDADPRTVSTAEADRPDSEGR